MAGGLVPSSASPLPSQHNCWPDPDLSYFSEPEFDSDYRQPHVHKAAKVGNKHRRRLIELQVEAVA